MGGEVEPNAATTFEKFVSAIGRAIDTPIVWFRKSIVEPNQKHYPWYHQKFRRVPTVDECYTDDPICIFEANQQFKRDKAVDSEVLTILRHRLEDCITYESPNRERCDKIKQEYDDAVTNWFIKYGDLGAYGNAEKALLKQKHRMIWERRHGPVGSTESQQQ